MDPTEPIVLEVSFGGRVIAAATHRDLPVELVPTISWIGRPGPLTIRDGQGRRTVFDFNLVPSEEASCAALSIRAYGNGVVQADCLLGRGAIPSARDFEAGNVRGLRMQPFFLADLRTDIPDLRGAGLFCARASLRGRRDPRKCLLALLV